LPAYFEDLQKDVILKAQSDPNSAAAMGATANLSAAEMQYLQGIHAGIHAILYGTKFLEAARQVATLLVPGFNSATGMEAARLLVEDYAVQTGRIPKDIHEGEIDALVRMGQKLALVQSYLQGSRSELVNSSTGALKEALNDRKIHSRLNEL
jgi:hypothetical protein